MGNVALIAKVMAAYFAALVLFVVLALTFHRAHETQAATPTGIVVSSQVEEP